MATYVHFECELCSRRVKTTDKKRILGNQAYFYKLRPYRKSNDDPITASNVVCARCNGSLSYNCIVWNPPKFMKIARANNPDEPEIVRSPAVEDVDMEVLNEDNNLYEENSISPENEIADDNVENEQVVPVPNSSCELEASESESPTGVTQSSTYSLNTQRSTGIEVNVVPSSQNKCCVCGNYSGRHSIPKSAIIGAWLYTRVFVPYRNRACRCHIVGGEFDAASLLRSRRRNQVITNGSALCCTC